MGCVQSNTKKLENTTEIQEHVSMYCDHHKRRSLEMRKSLESQESCGEKDEFFTKILT